MQIKLQSGSSAHVYYSNKNSLNTKLDVDDTTSYGPETITVESIQDNPGIYTYYVHDYTNRSYSSSTALSNSGATINIYFGSSRTPAYTLYVPSGTGIYWNVFTYNSVTGEITVVNTITSSAVIPN